MGLFGGGNSKSKSSSTSNITTINTDRRQAIAEGSQGFTFDSGAVSTSSGSSLNLGDIGVSGKKSKAKITSNTVVNMLDGGAIDNAFDFAKFTDATNKQGFETLLGLAGDFFTGAGELISKQQDALTSANETEKSLINQKSIVLIVGASLAVLAISKVK